MCFSHTSSPGQQNSLNIGLLSKVTTFTIDTAGYNNDRYSNLSTIDEFSFILRFDL